MREGRAGPGDRATEPSGLAPESVRIVAPLAAAAAVALLLLGAVHGVRLLPDGVAPSRAPTPVPSALAPADPPRPPVGAAPRPDPPRPHPHPERRADDTRAARADAELRRLRDAGARYDAAVGRPPERLEDLCRPVPGLPEGALGVAGTPLDPWGGTYRIRSEPGGRYVVTWGADGRPGGSGDGTDRRLALER